jgi:hypothetical protein
MNLTREEKIIINTGLGVMYQLMEKEDPVFLGLGDEPQGISYDSINHRIYVTNRGDDTVSVINLC